MDKEKIIAEAIAADACREGIEAFREWQGDNDSFMQEYPGHGWWALKNCSSFEVSAAVLDKCAEAKPAPALAFAAERLTPERLDKCAEAKPRAALEYAAKYLTPERKAWCKRKRRPAGSGVRDLLVVAILAAVAYRLKVEALFVPLVIASVLLAVIALFEEQN